MKVNNTKIRIPKPEWDSEITSLIIELEKLKIKNKNWNPRIYFFTIKKYFSNELNQFNREKLDHFAKKHLKLI